MHTFSAYSQSVKSNSRDSVRNVSLFEAVSDTITNINIFEDEEPLNIKLEYDITSFIRKKLKGEYMQAKLTLFYSNNDSITKNIKLKARGNFRRGHCFFPPIYLNFKTDPIKNTQLKAAKKIKLVTHCSTAKAYDKYILKEYLAYKLFNVFTDYSFKVRLLNIEYVDTGKRKRNYIKKGFIIEPLDVLTSRLNCIEINPAIVTENDVFEPESDLVSMFHFMIGNTDWRIKSGHNTKYVKTYTNLSNKVIPIPYDFDFSGFVNTSYSHPQSWTSIELVTDREYLGYCRNNEEAYLNTINKFIDKENEIIQTIRSFSYISEKDQKEMLRFIKEYFEMTKIPKNLIMRLKNECRTNF